MGWRTDVVTATINSMLSLPSTLFPTVGVRVAYGEYKHSQHRIAPSIVHRVSD